MAKTDAVFRKNLVLTAGNGSNGTAEPKSKKTEIGTIRRPVYEVRGCCALHHYVLFMRSTNASRFNDVRLLANACPGHVSAGGPGGSRATGRTDREYPSAVLVRAYVKRILHVRTRYHCNVSVERHNATPVQDGRFPSRFPRSLFPERFPEVENASRSSTPTTTTTTHCVRDGVAVSSQMAIFAFTDLCFD